MIQVLHNCNICPRKCNVNRHLKLGFCESSENIKINIYQLHHWEEPIISGTQGSGTIFFSSCNLKCVYCQNHKISFQNYGSFYNVDELSNIMLELQSKGAHNINFVTPAHFSKQIKDSIIIAKDKGLNIPIVWNTNAFEEVDSLKELEGLVDIYLPDFKYFDSEMSLKYSGAKDYPDKAKNAILEMYRQVGNIKVYDGIAFKGMMIRLLILPENINGIEKILNWIYENIGNKVFISLMGQYYPTHQANLFPEINRAITNLEYNFAIEQMEKFGFENGFIQDIGSSSKYTPEFK